MVYWLGSALCFQGQNEKEREVLAAVCRLFERNHGNEESENTEEEPTQPRNETGERGSVRTRHPAYQDACPPAEADLGRQVFRELERLHQQLETSFPLPETWQERLQDRWNS